MRLPNAKHADDVIVPDEAAGMKRLGAALRHVLSVHKPSNGSHPRTKSRKPKKH